MKSSTVVVIPSNRDVDDELISSVINEAEVLIVDGGGVQVTPRNGVTVLSVAEQDELIGKSRTHLIGRGAASLRNVGIWYAYVAGDFDAILTLDDDTYPAEGFVELYRDILFGRQQMTYVLGTTGWVSTLHRPGRSPIYPRGFPYEERFAHQQHEHAWPEHGRRPAAHVGLWRGTLDLNAVDKLTYNVHEPESSHLYATSDLLPLCGMNFGVRREWAPFVYQLPWTSFGHTLDLERYDDIIGGLFTCSLAAMEGGLVSFGPPIVDHRKKDTDLLTHAWRENLGNVLISRIGKAFIDARQLLRERDTGVNGTRFDRAHALLAAFELRAPDELKQVAYYCARTYEAWLGLFE